MKGMILNMNTLFIEEAEKINIIKKIYKPIECINEKIVLNLKLNKASIKKKMKIAKKIRNILDTHKSNTVIVSKNLKRNKEFINSLYSNNINITDGRKLFKRLAIDIAHVIVKQEKMNIKDCKIAILTNYNNEIIEKIIKELSIQCKSLQIITNHVKQFEKIENELYEDGIIINVTNNRRKSLLKTNIILNLDFPNEIINKYNIYDNAIIVNFEEKTRIIKKRFSGKIINWYKVGIKNEEKVFEFIQEQDVDKYDFNELIECLYFENKINPEYIYIE